MTDCSNIDVRDVLPEFLHGILDDTTRTRVQAHLDTCADCADELRLIQTVCAVLAAPSVDANRIASAVPPYRRRGAAYTIATRHLRLAAAALLLVTGASAVAVTHYHGFGQSGATTSGAASGISIVGVSDLSDDHLAQLIAAMDQLQATPPVDSEPAVPLDVEGGV